MHCVRTCAAMIAAASIVSVSAMAPIASAAPASYNESVSGDLPNYLLPLPVIPFDLGVNTVSGTLNIGSFTPGSTDSDSFAFTVPAGAELTLVGGEMQDVSGDMHYVVHNLNAGNEYDLDPEVLGTIQVFSPGSAVMASDALPLPAGTYSFRQDSMAAAAVNATSGYTYSFTVAPVPEPAGLTLLALVAPALLARRRR